MIVTHCVLWTPKENASLVPFCGRWAKGYVPYASMASLRCGQNDFNRYRCIETICTHRTTPVCWKVIHLFVSLKWLWLEEGTSTITDSDDAYHFRWHNPIMSIYRIVITHSPHFNQILQIDSLPKLQEYNVINHCWQGSDSNILHRDSATIHSNFPTFFFSYLTQIYFSRRTMSSGWALVGA